tara:strand:+ start:132 stop:746 length:615 start_codon:yes stop_codon:yes gene_type:complete
VLVLIHEAHTLTVEFDHDFGVKLDVRDTQGSPHLAHNPIRGEDSVSLIDWVTEFPNYAMYALSIKSDGNERVITSIMNSIVGEDRWFVFDMSYPCRMNYVAWGRNIVDRYSDLEEDVSPYSMNCGIWSDRWLWDKRKNNYLMVSRVVKVPHYYVSPELHLGSDVKKWRIDDQSYLHSHWQMVKDDSRFAGICTDFYEEAKEFFK